MCDVSQPIHHSEVNVFSIMIGDPILEAILDHPPLSLYLCSSSGITDYSCPLSTTAVIRGVVCTVGEISLSSRTAHIVHSELRADLTVPALLGHLQKYQQSEREIERER